MKTLFRQFLVSLLVLSILPLGSPASGDCGSIPYRAPLEVIRDISIVKAPESSGDVRFDPLKVVVYEPGQRGVILWNGEEEILLLSTDQRATQTSGILEVFPMPNRPEVRLGSFETFELAQRLVVQKHMWACAHAGVSSELLKVPEPAGRIDFQERLGAHDLMVAEVLDSDRFVDFVQSHLQETYRTPEAPIRPEFVEIIQSYLDEGFTWFAFDVIQLADETRSREPIEFRFKSDSVFYPMRISTLERGKTQVDLLVFTSSGADRFEGLTQRDIKTYPRMDVQLNEIGELNAEWTDFFDANALVRLDRWKIEGKLAKFAKDVRVK